MELNALTSLVACAATKRRRGYERTFGRSAKSDTFSDASKLRMLTHAICLVSYDVKGNHEFDNMDSDDTFLWGMQQCRKIARTGSAMPPFTPAAHPPRRYGEPS